MGFLVETHAHTNVSDHAFCTLDEMLVYAAKIGLEGICITNHGPDLPDGPHIWHFASLPQLPEYVYGVRLFVGAEVNIINVKGELDIPSDLLAPLDMVIASIHNDCFMGERRKDYTDMYIKILENPNIDCLGHAGTPSYSFNIKEVMAAAKAYGKVFEINNHSFVARPNSISNCVKIAIEAASTNTPIMVSTDAHIQYDLGKHSYAVKMLDEINFPQELILNTNLERFNGFLSSRGKPHKRVNS